MGGFPCGGRLAQKRVHFYWLPVTGCFGPIRVLTDRHPVEIVYGCASDLSRTYIRHVSSHTVCRVSAPDCLRARSDRAKVTAT